MTNELNRQVLDALRETREAVVPIKDEFRRGVGQLAGDLTDVKERVEKVREQVADLKTTIALINQRQEKHETDIERRFKQIETRLELAKANKRQNWTLWVACLAVLVSLIQLVAGLFHR